MNGARCFSCSQPSVAGSPWGSFLVVWRAARPYPSVNDIVGRYFKSDGSSSLTDFVVNTYTLYDQFEPRIGTDAAGDSVVVWSSASYYHAHEGVFGLQLSNTAPEFTVTETFNHYGAHPQLAVAPSGDFVIVWQELSDGSYEGVFGQRYDNRGVQAGNPISVNSETLYSQESAAIALDSAGGFVVVWESPDGWDNGIFGRRFDSAGTATMPDFQVSQYTLGSQGAPRIAVDSGGNMLVTWRSDGQGSSCGKIWGRHFDASFAPTGPEFQINIHTTGCQRRADVAVSNGGDFVVVWESSDQDGSCYGIFGRRVDSTGTPVGGEFQVNSHTLGCQEYPSLAQHSEDGFIVVWQGAPGGIGGQRFFDRAPEMTFPVTSGTLDCSDPGLSTPTLTWDPDGYDLFRVTIGWDRNVRADAVNSGKAMLKTTSWTVPAKKWRKACLKSAALDPNQPTLYVQVLGVDRDLPSKNPARKRLSAVVQIKATK